MSELTDSELRTVIRDMNARVKPVTVAEVIERSAGGELILVDQPGSGQEPLVVERSMSPLSGLRLVAAVAAVALVLFLSRELGNDVQPIELAETESASSSATSDRLRPEPAPSQSERTERVAWQFAESYVALDTAGAEQLLHPEVQELPLSIFDGLSLAEQFDRLRGSDFGGAVDSCVVWDNPTHATCHVRLYDRLGQGLNREISTYLRLVVEGELVREVSISRAPIDIYIADVLLPYFEWLSSSTLPLVDVAYPDGLDKMPDVDSPEGRDANRRLIDLYLLEQQE